MKKGKLKYPCKIGGKSGRLYPAGTIVDVLDVMDPLVQDKFPGISSNSDSTIIPIRFLDRKTMTLHNVDHVEIIGKNNALHL